MTERDSLGNIPESDFKLNLIDQDGENSLLHLSDFVNREFKIKYYHNHNSTPMDFSRWEENPTRVYRSSVYFHMDTIRIAPSGRVHDNSILFSGSIGEKGVAWMLPEDYIPSMQ